MLRAPGVACWSSGLLPAKPCAQQRRVRDYHFFAPGSAKGVDLSTKFFLVGAMMSGRNDPNTVHLCLLQPCRGQLTLFVMTLGTIMMLNLHLIATDDPKFIQRAWPSYNFDLRGVRGHHNPHIPFQCTKVHYVT